jgi:hypothetical protein
MPHLFVKRTWCVALLVYAIVPTVLVAQSKLLRVVSSDGMPVPYAWVSVAGGPRHITDGNGQMSLGGITGPDVFVSATRIGYQPWIGKIANLDTSRVLTVTLTPIAQDLTTVTVTSDAPVRSHL